MAGINSGVINLIYDYIPKSERAATLGIKNALSGVIAFFVALIGGAVLWAIQSAGGVTVGGITIYAQQILALISFVITLLLIVYMRTVIAPLHKLRDVNLTTDEEALESRAR
jgi:uncharacterized membrane protein